MGNLSQEENIENLAKRYRKMHWGYIAKYYSEEEEAKYYKQAANILSKKYNHIINNDDIYEILSKKGHIYTMNIVNNENAFYEFKTGNILIYHFLNRMTQTLLHELVHKLGFSRENDDFKQMSVVFNEAGVELVSAKAIDDKEEIEFLFHNTSAKMPQKISDSFIAVALTNQINEAMGEESLERSILTGRNFFETEIIEKYGEGSFVFLKENIEDLVRIEKRYWKDYSILTDDQKKEQEEFMRQKIFKIQDFILETEFDKRFQKIDSLEKGKEFLNELNKFGLNRIKIRSENDNYAEWRDQSFKEVFDKYKKEIEQKYGKTHIEYDEKFWESHYDLNNSADEITYEEKREILNMSIEFQKIHKAKGFFSKLLDKIKGKPKSLPKESNIVVEEKGIKGQQYIGDISKNIVNFKSENKTILEEREK